MKKREEVDDWFEALDHPLHELMMRVREILLGADDRVDECIKWKTPTFTYEGNLVSFNPRAKKHVSLLFHTGAKIPGTHALFEGGGETARYVKVFDAEDAEQKKAGLEAIVQAWITYRDASPKKRKRKG